MAKLTPRPGGVVRDFMLWLFDVPFGEPYVSATVDVRWEAAARYLSALEAATGDRVTTQHLFVAAIGRLYKEFPEINARIFGRRIWTLPTVDVAMPVNLLGREVGHELSMVLVRGVEALDPRGVAAATRPQVEAERKGESASAFVRALLDGGKRSPGAMRFALRSVAAAAHDPRLYELVARTFPVSTLVTNVGAALGADMPVASGVRFRAVALSPPSKLVHLGSLFGLGPLERTAVVDGDAVRVGTVLPVVFVFDHRLVDGVLAGRILARLGTLLQDPAATWPIPSTS